MSHVIDLSGRRALVTGGSRGIGAAVVGLLATAGARVAFGYRDRREEADALVASCRAAGAEVTAHAVDLLEEGSAIRLLEEARAGLDGAPDILVANAGIWEHTPLNSLDGASLRRTLRLNVESVVELVRAATPAMVERNWGRVVLIGSTAGQRGEAEHAAYAMSKGAIHLLARSLGSELASRGVAVNVVAPGWVDTEMTARALRAEGAARIAASIPRGRVASAEEIAGPVLFLCSDLCAHMIGSVLSVNGGAVMA
ncbi:MAG: SDR family oxidoreductase [Planctomycetes bacterium]|nr:SDR family oxidoreductase [Planctomycetota bacterium]